MRRLIERTRACVNAQADIERYSEIARRVLPFVGDTISLVNDAYDQGKRILVEGANATMLDVRWDPCPVLTHAGDEHVCAPAPGQPILSGLASTSWTET